MRKTLNWIIWIKSICTKLRSITYLVQQSYCHFFYCLYFLYKKIEFSSFKKKL